MGADRKVISISCAFVLCVSSVLEGNNQEMDGRAILSVVFFHPVSGISFIFVRRSSQSLRLKRMILMY